MAQHLIKDPKKEMKLAIRSSTKNEKIYFVF